MSGIAIYYHPASGTSRNTLAMICNGGQELAIVGCLKTLPSREKHTELIKAPQRGAPADEGSEAVIDAQGRRVSDT